MAPTGPVQLTTAPRRAARCRRSRVTWTPSTGRRVAGDRAGVADPAAGLVRCRRAGAAVTGGIRCRRTSQARASSARKVAVVLAQPAPQLGGDGTQPVDRRAPVAGARRRCARRARCTVARASSRSWARVMPGGGGTGRGGGQHVRARHGVVPRDRVQVPSGPVGGDRDVDHGQAGADQQQVAARGLAGPRVGEPAGRRREPGRCPVGAGPAPVASTTARATIEPAVVPSSRRTTNRSPRPVDADDAGVASDEPGVAGVLSRRWQQALDVVAVHAAGDEVLGLGLRVVVLCAPSGRSARGRGGTRSCPLAGTLRRCRSSVVE